MVTSRITNIVVRIFGTFSKLISLHNIYTYSYSETIMNCIILTIQHILSRCEYYNIILFWSECTNRRTYDKICFITCNIWKYAIYYVFRTNRISRFVNRAQRSVYNSQNYRIIYTEIVKKQFYQTLSEFRKHVSAINFQKLNTISRI